MHPVMATTSDATRRPTGGGRRTRRSISRRPPAARGRAVRAVGPRARRSSTWPTRSARRAHGRAAGLAAARDAFYRGDLAQAMVRFHREQRRLAHRGGSRRLPLRDRGAAPLHVPRHRGPHVRAVVPGPGAAAVAHAARGRRSDALGHNTPAYVHRRGRGDEALLRRPRAVLRRSAVRRRCRSTRCSRPPTRQRAAAHPRRPRVARDAAARRRGGRDAAARRARPAPRRRGAAPTLPGDTSYVLRGRPHGNVCRPRRATCRGRARSSPASGFVPRRADRSRGPTGARACGRAGQAAAAHAQPRARPPRPVW